nr:hypothetical transcript [Hymenolepis microstoma]
MRVNKPSSLTNCFRYVPKILISNLPPHTNEADVFKICLEYGPIDHIRLRWESNSEKKNMVAEVIYATTSQALQAWKGLKTKIICGRKPEIFTVYYNDSTANLPY